MKITSKNKIVNYFLKNKYKHIISIYLFYLFNTNLILVTLHPDDLPDL